MTLYIHIHTHMIHQNSLINESLEQVRIQFVNSNTLAVFIRLVSDSPDPIKSFSVNQMVVVNQLPVSLVFDSPELFDE